MAKGKKYHWMKLKESFMSSDTIDYFMSQPDGANYVVLYQMLCLKTINTAGRLSRQIGEITIPYDASKIQRDCKWFSVNMIRKALKLYQAVGLIYEDTDGTLVLADHSNLVGSETDYAVQKKSQRQNSQKTMSPYVDNSVDNVHLDNVENSVENVHTEIDSKSIDTTLQKAEPEQCPFKEIKSLYTDICVSFPRIRTIDGNRKKAVAARWRTYKSLDTFRELFTTAERSSFLKGNNNRNWSADFDWMMKPKNFSKILEHKYDDRAAENIQSGVIGTLQRMYEEADNK